MSPPVPEPVVVSTPLPVAELPPDPVCGVASAPGVGLIATEPPHPAKYNVNPASNARLMVCLRLRVAQVSAKFDRTASTEKAVESRVAELVTRRWHTLRHATRRGCRRT